MNDKRGGFRVLMSSKKYQDNLLNLSLKMTNGRTIELML